MKLHNALLGTVMIASVACISSPFWRFDSISVSGQLQGASCSLALNGVPAADSASAHDSLTIMIDYAANVGLPEGVGVKTVFCRGLQLSIAGPSKSLPAVGSFPVGEGSAFHSDRYSVALFSPIVDGGHWPLAVNGAYLEGIAGSVVIDSITPARVWGRFQFQARRRARGS